ncbi:MAG: phosphoglycerate dehydrogenase [Dictyoglomus sp. NZ13-RE01]|nr:MAG: phosphoglycerate dehydrogenase [Dictyoglomus sp. NZ13-RE01]
MEKILISDPIAEQGIKKLQEYFEVDFKPGISKDELIKIIPEYSGLVVRSETKVTQEVISAGRKLKVIGRAGVGVDNIDVEYATKKGILVINAPEGNTIAAAEHTMALILSLSRRIPHAYFSLREGKWDRKSFVGHELYGKTLGLVGLGRIGSEVAKRAKAFKMRIVAYDPYISPEKAKELEVELLSSLDELLKVADYVSLHLPLTPETENLIGERELSLMKPSSYLINCARGKLVDEGALYNALKEKRIAGAALDVFRQEPLNPDNPLLTLDNVVLTPHLGASTQEAQEKVAVIVAEEIIKYFKGEPVMNAVNLPIVISEEIMPYIKLGEKLGRFLAQITDFYPEELEIQICGELSQKLETSLASAVVKGFLEPILMDSVNLINALALAKERRLKIKEVRTQETEIYRSMLKLSLKTEKGIIELSGTLSRGQERIVKIQDYYIDLNLAPYLLIVFHVDKPGIIGKVGTILGKNDINIAAMQVGRKEIGREAVMVLIIDNEVSQEVISELKSIENINKVYYVKLA